MKMVMTTLTDHEEQARRNAENAMENCGIDDVELILGVNEEGEGYVTGMNKALAQVPEGEYFVTMNDDSHPDTDDWLAVLKNEMDKRSPLTVWFAGPSGGCRTAPQNQGRIGDKRRPTLVKHLASFCMLCHPDVLTEVGMMDDDFHHYAGEVDWQWRARKEHNAHSLWVPGVYVIHNVHEPNREWWAQDQSLLNQKWRQT